MMPPLHPLTRIMLGEASKHHNRRSCT